MDAFNRNRRNKDGLQGYCRECQAEQQREYRSTAAGKARDARYEASEGKRAVWRRYRAKPAVRARINKRWREWYASSVEAQLRHRAKASARHALKMGATTTPFTRRDLYTQWDEDGMYRCVYCDGPYEHIDHVLPLVQGGEHSIGNLVPACADCNLRKGDADPWTWILRTVAA